MEIDKPTQELLNEMGFKPGKDAKLYELKIEGGFAYVDFRTTDGRRYAMIDRKPVPEKDLVEKAPVLIEFKKRRDEIQNELLKTIGAGVSSDKTPSMSINKGLESPPQQPHIQEQQGKDSPPIIPPVSKSSGGTILKETPHTINSPPAPDNPNLYEFFFELVGAGGIVEIFGDTGSLKSQLCTETCKDTKKLGKTFFYLDTEGKVGLFNKKFLNNAYQYLPIWEEILEKVEKNLPKADILIIDSLGFPVAVEVANMKANELGESFNEMMAMVGKFLKAWAFKNNAIILFTNQPKSAFMKSEGELARLGAYGDKVHFAPNIIIKSEKTIIPGKYDEILKKVIPTYSIGKFTSFRSTDFADDTILFHLHKNNDSVKVELSDQVISRLKKLKE